MDNLAGPGYESPVRRYAVDSTSNADRTPPVVLNRFKGLLRGNTLIAKSQESADPSSPKRTGARKKTVKLQGGATITLCPSCVTSNKIEEKIQPKRRRSVAKDEAEEKPKRTNKKKQDETAKDQKTRAKKVTAEKISKPRITRKATENKENELLKDGNANASNEAQTEIEHQQLTQDEENNKKTRKPRAVKPKNTSKKDSETKETKKPIKPRQRNATKNAAEENIESGLDNMNVTDLVNSIIEKNKAELADNNEMSEKSTHDPIREDDHITKRMHSKVVNPLVEFG